MRSICVFCGSSMGRKPVYRDAAAKLGQLIGENGDRLVFGGSNIGLMTVIADETMKHGGEAVGVMPHHLVSKEIAHQGLTKFVACETMAERKQMMGDMSDAFVAMPGGFGTLDELAEVLTWLQLNITDKPVAILNTDGFYDHLMAWLDRSRDDGFLRSEHRNNIIIANTPAELMEKLFSFEFEEVPSKWVDEIRKDSGHDVEL